MIALEYNSIIQNQYEGVNKSRKQLGFYFGNLFSNWLQSVTKRGLKRIHQLLFSQLVSSKGLLLDIKEKSAELQGQNLAKVVGRIEMLIKVNITLKDQVEKILAEDDANEFPEARAINRVVEETIETLYSTLRILKKCSDKSTAETSSEAIDCSKHSLNTLQSVLHARRTT